MPKHFRSNRREDDERNQPTPSAKTAAHSADVAAEARRVALLTGADPGQAEAAGWLHDISAGGQGLPPLDAAAAAKGSPPLAPGRL